MITRTSRRHRARALLAAATTALAVLADPVSASAAPSVLAGGPTPAPAAGSTVLFVHVAAGTSLARLADRLPGVRIAHRFGGLHQLSVRVRAAAAAQTCARLSALPGVTRVERGPARHFSGSAAPDDTYFAGRQARYLDAVAAPAAWASQHGSATVRLAVLDSGIDVTHPDLAGKVVGRYDAVDGSTRVSDEVGHGTFVAGVAAAETGNGTGVAGAGWNTSLDAVKIADADGGISIDDEVAGIRWATAQHVDVINLSLGGPDRNDTEAAAIAAAERAGIVVVAAAGNESDTAPSYPAAYPGVIAVGATDTAHRTRAGFSNHGSWVTVAAPGVGIYSTVPKTSLLWSSQPSGYASGDGTSFSTPLVAGEVALLRAQNPHASAAQLRHAVVASAHGYPRLGLGAGQVDFARALLHLPPSSAPTAVRVQGRSGVVTMTAHAAAARVAFAVDGRPRLPSVPVRRGVARATFATWGLRNGPQHVRAYACSAYGECSAAAGTAAWTIANPAPVVRAPAPAASLTGRVVVTGTSAVGGPVRLLVDGRSRGVVDAAPYRFPVSTSDLRDGRHLLRLQGCSADHRVCAGPSSAAVAVRTDGLHPEISALAPVHVSPNGDRVHDTASLRFRLPDREVVLVRVLDARGRTVRAFHLGSLGAGRHAFTWRARTRSGPALRDGRYVLVLDTTRGSRRGWVQHAAVVDTVRPRLARPRADVRTLYPYRDHYRDTVSVRTRLGEPGRLTLTVRSRSGTAVRRLHAQRPAGPATVVWNGRRFDGRAVPAGTYRAQLALTDAAGNTTRRAPFTLTVSAKRLRTVTRAVDRPAAARLDSGGTAACASARTAGSRFAGGLYLLNRCSSNGFDLAFADYAFRLPAALAYRRITFAVRGRSRARPAELSAAFTLDDGSLEIPNYVAVRRATTSWYRIAGVPAAHHVGSGRRVRVSLLLDSFYAGRNDFDAATVRLLVRMTVLR